MAKSFSPISFTNDRNMNRLRIGGVLVLFSYDATVAFTDREGRSYVNPRYRNYSKTTSKHLNEAGYKNAPDAPSEDHFNAYLADALRIGAEKAQDSVVESLRDGLIPTSSMF